MSQARPKHAIYDSDSLIRISIPTPKRWFRIGVVTLALIIGLAAFINFGWSQIVALYQFDTGNWPASTGLPIIGLGAAIALWLAGLCELLFLLFGCEIIEISRESIRIRLQLFGLGHSRQYNRHQVKGLHISAPMYPEYRTWPRTAIWWGPSDGAIIFAHDRKTVRFGLWMDEMEARKLLDVIQMRFPQYGQSETGRTVIISE